MKTRMIRAAASVLALAAIAAPAAAQTTMTREQVERRHNIRLFGNTLVGAAQHGAELLGLRVQQIDPSIILLSGTQPRAQGFVIDGHGVFFYVEIPGINPAIAWAMQTRGRDQVAQTAIADLRQLLQSVEDPQERTQFALALRSIEQRLLPPGAVQQRREGAVQTVGTVPSPMTAPPPVMENPDAEYRQLVTEQLVNAMLDHSHQLGLAADEWLTVAARGSQGPLLPDAVFDDRVPVTLRVKGSDLADFRAGRLTREEARARVVIREF
ncbi:MAG TPA: hypothetical protein VFZ36_00580 [Vicinamibacterales bacterium]